MWLENEIGSDGDEEKTVVCTGLTRKEVAKQMKAGEVSREKPVKCCYVCKRQEGQEGAAVICTDSDVSLMTPEIKLFAVERQFHGSPVVFFLCFECALLLNPEWSERVKGGE